MFRHEGPSRSVRTNAVVAAYLAAVAGFVNSGGFVLVGAFTSHVTGSVGRLGNDVAADDWHAAALALLMVVTFFVGATVASLVLARADVPRSRAYAAALLIEALALAAFVWIASGPRTHALRTLDLHAAILCFAMGLQNSLVTRLSGAVVRTTHLTGVVTDLGIETAHWLRWIALRGTTTTGIGDTSPPSASRFGMLFTIVVAFVLGSVVGAWLVSGTHGEAMLLPAGAVLAASVYAFVSARGTG